jgi:hypothetical protein
LLIISEGKILLLQPAEIRGNGTGRDPLQGVIPKRRAGIPSLHHALFDAENGVPLRGFPSLAIGALGFNGLGKQHGGFLLNGC